jgi:adenine C2-methylase RlmN of 23S rRNA A2503 and tRNA A37
MMVSFNKLQRKDKCLHKSIESSGIVVKVRRSRGKDIDAACGQLANKEV